MRENANHNKYEQGSYATERPQGNLGSKKKVDMNDLLARVRKEEIYNKKINIIIFSGVVLVLSLSLMVFI